MRCFFVFTEESITKGIKYSFFCGSVRNLLIVRATKLDLHCIYALRFLTDKTWGRNYFDFEGGKREPLSWIKAPKIIPFYLKSCFTPQ